MVARVFGLGVGLFILAFIWIITLLLCITCTRYQGVDGAIGPTIIAIIITIILVFFPREGPTVPQQVDVRIVDHYFILRICLVVFMCLCLVIGLLLLLSFHWTRPVYAQPIRINKR